jgi:hypothetical protein
VMGVGRSGTSLTINLLKELGFYVEDDNRRPDEYNAQGYGESVRLRKITDKIFAIFKLGNSEAPLPPNWLEDPGVIELHEEAKQLVSDMNTHGDWAWKVPRLALTFPFWEPLLPNDHCCLICVRNPLAAMKSRIAFAHHRHTAEDATITWFLRSLAAIRNTRKQRRLFVFYEDYFDPDSTQLKGIATFVGKRPDDKALNLVSPGLKHFEFTLEDVLRSDKLTVNIKLLYVLLLQAKENPEIFDAISQVSDESEEKVYDMMKQLEYYKAISRHPYVRFGLRMNTALHRL